MPRFGHREGVRRNQRYGQTTLDVGPTLDNVIQLPARPGFAVFGFRNRREVERYVADAGIGERPSCVVCDGTMNCEFCPKV
jgi:hypothetical protein